MTRGRSPSGKPRPMAAVATAKAKPAPTPCTARNATNAAMFGATAQATLPTAKTTIVIRNVLRTPTASMRGPAIIVANVEVTRKLVTNHPSRPT